MSAGVRAQDARTARALWIEGPGRARLRSEALEPGSPGQSLLAPEFGGVSVGTERLVARGLVPPALRASMACRGQAGSLGLPVKYGYSMAGTVRAGELAGERVFCMHPHQELAWIETDWAVRLPPDVSTRRAVLFPNLETGLNAVWDAELGPADTCVVFGAGALGLLIAYAAAAESGARPLVVEPDPERRALAGALPWVDAALAPGEPLGAPRSVAFHTTATEAGLQASLDAVGFEGRVVELSWYGTRPVRLELGGSFHSDRKRLLASQVAHVAPARRASEGHAGRTARVLELLREPALERLLGPPMPFSDLPAFIERLAADAATAGLPPVPLIDYSTR